MSADKTMPLYRLYTLPNSRSGKHALDMLNPIEVVKFDPHDGEESARAVYNAKVERMPLCRPDSKVSIPSSRTLGKCGSINGFKREGFCSIASMHRCYFAKTIGKPTLAPQKQHASNFFVVPKTTR